MSDYSADFEALEEALRQAEEGHYVLKLYVSGSSPRSTKAIANLKTICEEHLTGRYDLEVIDVYQQPELARQNQLVAAPTLIKEQPQPVRKLVGDMSNESQVLFKLNIVKQNS